MHTYESTWEGSVSCQHRNIKPSYIKQFMNPLMMQSTSNTILTFILRDTFHATLEGFEKANPKTQEAVEKRNGERERVGDQ